VNDVAEPFGSSRTLAFSDGVFAIAITLLILEIRVPPESAPGGLGNALVDLWPSYLAFLVSFATIGVMWLNHHRLFTLINKVDDGLIGLNLLLLLGVTWVPFPTALLAEHLLGPDQHIAAVVYAGTGFGLALVFNGLWRHVVRHRQVVDHLDVDAITRQYALGPIFYAASILIALVNATALLVVSGAFAVYFTLPPRLWRRK
jgi:uncharacterized membrane protein